MLENMNTLGDMTGSRLTKNGRRRRKRRRNGTPTNSAKGGGSNPITWKNNKYTSITYTACCFVVSKFYYSYSIDFKNEFCYPKNKDKKN